MKLATGDELCGQEQAFRDWAREVFTVSNTDTAARQLALLLI
jgi:hypothetical protein